MIYVASRVRHAEMWKRFRAAGCPIISTWIDEAGEGESGSMRGLWEKIEAEVEMASTLVLYAEPVDFPLKGALVEAGGALFTKKRVYVCLPGVEVEERSCHPIGSWIKHGRVHRHDDINALLRWL